MALRYYLIGEVAEDYADGLLTRREALRRLGLLGLGAAAAGALLAGYGALCVDLLSAQGGTAALKDPAQAPTALANAPVAALVADLRAGVDELGRRVPGGKVGTVGFCFGGGMVWQLLAAGEARLAAAVPFYGPAPDQPDFSHAKAAVLAIYGGLDTRVDATMPKAEAALRAAGLTYQVRVFDNADHAFFNDTGPRYQPVAARQAWDATLDWFGRYLAG